MDYFRFMLFHCFVPDDFGKGFVIPLLKDRMGCINSLDNYRGITLIPDIAKLFELVLFHLCSQFLQTDARQFGLSQTPVVLNSNTIFIYIRSL